MGRNLVPTLRTGTTMRLRELCQEWNPLRLRRLLKQAQEATNANIHLCSTYFMQMKTAQKQQDHAYQLLHIRARRIETLEQELEARNGELAALRRETQ